MKRYATAALLLGFALLPTACLQQSVEKAQAEQPTTPKMPPPQHLGAVHQVYPEQGFALLRIIGPMPGAGTTLISHPANGSGERIGNLCISSLQPSRDGIVAADIRSGTVVKGDRVFRYRSISSQSSTQDVIAAEPPAGYAGLTQPDIRDMSAIPAPAEADEEDEAPIPPPEAASAVETTVLPTYIPATPGSDPGAPDAPAQAPDYLNSIPDSIDGWDSM